MASTSTESPAADVASAAGPSISYASTSEPMASGSRNRDSDQSTDSADATDAAADASTSSKARLEDLLGSAAGEPGVTDGGASSSGAQPDGSDGGSDSTYECTICLETAKDAVVSLCGHLFCWPCLHQWLETRPQRQMCPVCKAAISKEKVIPLYGRDSKNQQDPRLVGIYSSASSFPGRLMSFVLFRRTKAPPRPTAQRTEPESSNFHGFGFPEGGGFHMSFGIGAFPFGFFTSTFNFGNEARPARKYQQHHLMISTHSAQFLGNAAAKYVWKL